MYNTVKVQIPCSSVGKYLKSMNEYQFFDFLAVDQRLDRQAKGTLRSISTRANVSSVRFTNEYEWGELKADPLDLMKRWFDLHYYFIGSGECALMMRLPKKLIDLNRLSECLAESDKAELVDAGDSVILDIFVEDGSPESGRWEDDCRAHLDRLAPLRGALLSGDFRLPYLLWLDSVSKGKFDDDRIEPMAGITSLTEELEWFIKLFGINTAVVAAALVKPKGFTKEIRISELRTIVASISSREKDALLLRLLEDDPHVGMELRKRALAEVRSHRSSRKPTYRTVKTLRHKAKEIQKTRRAGQQAWTSLLDEERKREQIHHLHFS